MFVCCALLVFGSLWTVFFSALFKFFPDMLSCFLVPVSHVLGKYFTKPAILTNSRWNRGPVGRLRIWWPNILLQRLPVSHQLIFHVQTGFCKTWDNSNYFVTVSEVFRVKSQTETLKCWLSDSDSGQYGKAEFWDFPVKTEHSRLISCLFYGLIKAVWLFTLSGQDPTWL